jgi:hypothetical protein
MGERPISAFDVPKSLAAGDFLQRAGDVTLDD